jgi:FkbM family methyltransferase
MISRLRYYLSLLPLALFQIQNPFSILALLFRRQFSKPAVLRLRDGAQFQVRTAMDVWIIIETYLARDYERHGFDLQSNWLVIDIGAGLGDFAITAAKKCRHGFVYAYEPFPESFELMQRNLSLNRVENVDAQPYAVGATPGEMHLRTASGVPVLYSTAADDDHVGKDDVSVRATTLDEIFETFKLKTCDLLKMDCEGAEYDILFHTRPSTLQKMKRICLEYHDGVTEYSHLDLIDFFEKNGFSVLRDPSPVHKHTGLLFVSKQ